MNIYGITIHKDTCKHPFVDTYINSYAQPTITQTNEHANMHSKILTNRNIGASPITHRRLKTYNSNQHHKTHTIPKVLKTRKAQRKTETKGKTTP